MTNFVIPPPYPQTLIIDALLKTLESTNTLQISRPVTPFGMSVING